MTITQMRAAPDDAINRTNPVYPNKRIKFSNGYAVGDAADVTCDDQVLDSVFVFTTEKSPFDVRCFPITNEDIVAGSFRLKYTLPAADWGSSAKDKLTLSLDKRERVQLARPTSWLFEMRMVGKLATLKTFKTTSIAL